MICTTQFTPARLAQQKSVYLSELMGLYQSEKRLGRHEAVAKIALILKRILRIGNSSAIFLGCLESENFQTTVDILTDLEQTDDCTAGDVATSFPLDANGQPSPKDRNPNSPTFNNFLNLADQGVIDRINQNRRLEMSRNPAVETLLGVARMDELTQGSLVNNSIILMCLKATLVQNFELIEQRIKTEPANARQFFEEFLTLLSGTSQAVKVNFWKEAVSKQTHLRIAYALLRTSAGQDLFLCAALLEVLAVFLADHPNHLPEALQYRPSAELPTLLDDLLPLAGRFSPVNRHKLVDLFQAPFLIYLDQKYVDFVSQKVIPHLAHALCKAISAHAKEPTLALASPWTRNGNTPSLRSQFWLVCNLHILWLRLRKEQLVEAVLTHNLLESFACLDWAKPSKGQTLAFLEYFSGCLYWLEVLSLRELNGIERALATFENLLNGRRQRFKGLIHNLVLNVTLAILRCKVTVVLAYADRLGQQTLDRIGFGSQEDYSVDQGWDGPDSSDQEPLMPQRLFEFEDNLKAEERKTDNSHSAPTKVVSFRVIEGDLPSATDGGDAGQRASAKPSPTLPPATKDSIPDKETRELMQILKSLGERKQVRARNGGKYGRTKGQEQTEEELAVLGRSLLGRRDSQDSL